MNRFKIVQSRSKVEDPEQIKLKQRAKEVRLRLLFSLCSRFRFDVRSFQFISPHLSFS